MQIALVLYLLLGIPHWGNLVRASQYLVARPAELKTSVCEILQKPKSFDGKVVTIHARALMGFESLTLVQSGCPGSIWLAYPDEIKHISNSRRPEVTLVHDADFDRFQKAIGAEAEDTPQHPCQSMHCMKQDVEAEITGRIDYRPTSCNKQSNVSNSKVSKCGYGHMGAWNVQLVLEKVSNLVTIPRP